MSKGDKSSIFWQSLQKQYQRNNPMNYIFRPGDAENKLAKKFMMIINKIVQILKNGMDPNALTQDEAQSSHFWQEICRIYERKVQIRFVNSLYVRRQLKFAPKLIESLNHLYIVKNKKQSFLQNIKIIQFLKNGNYILQSEYNHDFEKFKEKCEMQQLQMKNQIKNLLFELVEKVELIFKIEYQKLQKEKIKKENQKRQQQIKLQKQRKQQIQIINLKQKQQKKQVNKITTNLILQQPIKIPFRKKHQKNSQHLYQEQYQQYQKLYKYFMPQKLQPSKQQINCSQQDCNNKLTNGLYIIGSNKNYCNYYGRWYCNQHFAQERIAIPRKAKYQFDLKGYYVSKRAYNQIKLYFQNAIIQISPYDPIVQRNPKLGEFLILKRQIHLMYDSICNPELMQKVFGKRKNYFLKPNLFSLKNLYDIYNGHEYAHLQSQFNIFCKHFYGCPTCQSKKGRICGQCKVSPKIFAFQLKDNYSCKYCHHIYHRRCLISNKCPCQTNTSK